MCSLRRVAIEQIDLKLACCLIGNENLTGRKSSAAGPANFFFSFLVCQADVCCNESYEAFQHSRKVSDLYLLVGQAGRIPFCNFRSCKR